MDLVSVLMSTYKEPVSWIEKSVESILSQTYTNIEYVIVIDDPTNKEVVDFLNRKEESDSRIVLVKNEKNKTYKNMFGVTDYDIPMFGFKSALLILGATMLSLIVCVNGFHYLHIDFRLPNAIISSIVCGLSVAYSQFYIERKKGMCKSFWIVAGIFTIMAFVMILMIR